MGKKINKKNKVVIKDEVSEESQEPEEFYESGSDAPEAGEKTLKFSEQIPLDSMSEGSDELDGRASMYSGEEAVSVEMEEEEPQKPEDIEERRKQKRIEKLEKKIKALQKKQGKSGAKKPEKFDRLTKDIKNKHKR